MHVTYYKEVYGSLEQDESIQGRSLWEVAGRGTFKAKIQLADDVVD